MMRGMTVTDLVARAMAVAVHSLGIAQAQWLSVYNEGVSEAKRQRDLSEALVETWTRDDTEDIKKRVKSEGGVLYASARTCAGLLGFIGRVSLYFWTLYMGEHQMGFRTN